MKDIPRFSSDFLTDNGLQVETNILHESIPLHWHEFYELEYILSGTGSYSQNGITYPALPGTLFFSTYMDFHEIKVKNELSILSLKFDEHWITPLFSGDLIRSAVFENFDAALLFKIKACFKKPTMYQKLYLENMITCLLIELVTKTDSSIASASFAKLSPAVKQAMQYIHLHFHESISATDIAKNSGYAAAHFSTIFKEQTGKSIKQHINEHRVDYAKRLLRYTDIPVTDICYLVGFNTFSSFFRVFSHFTGISPREYKMDEKLKNEKLVDFSNQI